MNPPPTNNFFFYDVVPSFEFFWIYQQISNKESLILNEDMLMY